MDLHSLCVDEEAIFCLFPLHPGPCARGRRNRNAPPQQPASTQTRRSIPLRRTVIAQHPGGDTNRPPAKKTTGTVYGTPQKKAQGRAAVGQPPAKSAPAKKAGGTVYGTPAKKAAKKVAKKASPAKKAVPTKAAPPRSRGAAADAGNAAQMLLSGSGSVDSRRYVQTLMQHVTAAREADRNRGDGEHTEYNRMVTRSALEIGRVLAHEAGTSGDERRRLQNRIAQIANDAMRTGDTRAVAALKRELAQYQSSRTASAYTREDRALALFGLQRLDVSMYGMPPFPLGPMNALGHLECGLSVFCRNPLHPGPCKGWKGTLAKVAPGALHLIEQERKKKLAEKRAKIAAAKLKASKIVDAAKRGVEVDEHPNAKKKLGKTETAKILGADEAKVTDIEGKTKLSQKEIAWHANKRADALLAANVAAGNLESKAARQKYRQYARAQIIAALQADNESGATGPDSEYQKTIASLSQGIATGHAGKYVQVDSDEQANLHAAVADAFDAAIQADTKNVVAGKPAINLKKLTKALNEIPGEPGDSDHDVAVGGAVGHVYEPPANALPSGALSDEDADKLAKGAAGILKLTTDSPETIANSQKNAKAKAQTEGFADVQDSVLAKTAANVTTVAAAQNHEGLDGFSPQGKKKFEKVLAGELHAMLANGDEDAPAGSLAELVVKRKKGEISPDEFHAAVQAKLKIKSKKLDAQKAAATKKVQPDAPATGDAGGGAGAGGVTKNKQAADTLGAVDQEIYDDPPSPSELKGFENALAQAHTEEERDQVIKAYAASKAKGLVNVASEGKNLTPEQKAAIEGVAADYIAGSLKGTVSTNSIKALVKNLKSKDAKDLKDFADAMMPKGPSVNAVSDDADTGGTSVNAIGTPSANVPSGAGGLDSKALPEQKASLIAVKAGEAYSKLMGGDTPSAEMLELSMKALTKDIQAGHDPHAKAGQVAKALAKAWVQKKTGGSSSMPLLHQAALQDAIQAEIEQGMITGEFPVGGYLDKAGNPKGGFVKLKILAKKAFEANAGPGAKSSMPLLPKKSTKDAELDDAMDAAFGDTPATPGGHATTLKPKLAKHANLSTKLAGQISHSGTAAGASQDYEKELAAATSQADIDKAVTSLGSKMAGAQAGSALAELGLLPGDDIPMETFAKLANQLQADWTEAVATDADAPGGMAANMADVVALVKQQAATAQKANGFPDDSPALKQYKAALFQAHVDKMLGDSTPPVTTPGGGAGAGGTGTGVNPGAAAAVADVGGKKLTPIQQLIAKQKAAQAASAGTPGATPVVDTLPPAPATPDAPSAPAPVTVKPAPKAALPAQKKPQFTKLTRVGPQKGSNPGGTFEAPDGTQHYVKQQKSKKHAQNEATAAALYRAGGVQVPTVHVGQGTPGLSGPLTSSEIVPGAQPLSGANLAQHQAAIRQGFAVDAWLGNWDVAGLSMDNIVIGGDGQPHRIDVGGALAYRAQGTPKTDFGDDVPEFDTLRDPSKNSQAAKIFAGMSDAELISSLEQVEAVTPEQISQIVADGGLDDAMAKRLIARRAALLGRLNELRTRQIQQAPESGQTAGEVKLGGTKKKQKILKPQGIYPISQVVVDGHEANVAAYNSRVAAGVQGKEAADVPRQMKNIKGQGSTALKVYSGSGYQSINGHLRAGGGPGTSGSAARVAQMDKEFDKSRLDQPITTLRGFSGSSAIFGALWTERRDQNWSGAEFRDLAYGSSSVQMSTARGFASAGSPDAVVMRIHMPAGTRAINLGKSSSVPGEAEVLLNRGARFRIVADNGYQNGARHLDVEVICDADDCG